MDTIGCVGCGFVGQAVAKGFSPFSIVKTYDINPNRCSNTFKEVVNCDFVFISLPTPMTKVEGGECNLDIINKFFDEVSTDAHYNKSIYIIKSTVPVGTTKRISKEYDIKKIVHNPEFLTAKNALIDYLNPERNIVGGQDKKSVKKVKRLLTERFPSAPCYTMSSDESEMVKYVANCFLATKVIFFNEMKLLADKLNINWDNVIEGVISDGRIGRTHYKVPGEDSQKGISGACFPKDLNAMIASFKEHGLTAKVLEAVWEVNKDVREVWDWETIPYAVMEKKET